MHPSKISKLIPGGKFRITKGGNVFKVLKVEERDGGIMLSFSSLRPVANGRITGTINLKLITNLHICDGVKE